MSTEAVDALFEHDRELADNRLALPQRRKDEPMPVEARLSVLGTTSGEPRAYHLPADVQSLICDGT